MAAHLMRVATEANELADAFGAGSLASCLGWLHDIGNCNPGFQTSLGSGGTGTARRKGPPCRLGRGAYL